MAITYIDGLQDPVTAPKPEWFLAAWGSAANGRDGSANGAAGSPNTPRYLTMSQGSSTMVMGFGLMPTFSGLFGGSGMMISWSNGPTPVFLLHMGINANGFLDFRRGANYSGGTIIATSSGHDPLTLNVWRHIQIKYVAHLTAGTLVVKIDGLTVINLTGVQTSNATATPDRWHHNGGNNYGANLWWIDDLWILDGVDVTATTGRALNDFLGDIKVTTLLPTSDGDTLGWTPSTGTSHAATVDEVPPNTTDYVSTAVSGTRDLWQHADLPATTLAVYGLRVHLYALKTDAGACSVSPVLKDGAGTVSVQTAKALTTLASVVSGDIVCTKPSAPTTPLTLADVNALQIGVQLQ